MAAVVLAAGRATRFGAGPQDSKVFASFENRSLVAHVVLVALASRASPVIVVTGHAGHLAEASLSGAEPDRIVHNPDHAAGMATSLRTGLAALPVDATGALVLLADMPLVASSTLDLLIAAFADGAHEAVVPVFGKTRGNPVLLGRPLFAATAELRGDEGARRLLAEPGRRVLACPVDDPGILADVDTVAALAELRRR